MTDEYNLPDVRYDANVPTSSTGSDSGLEIVAKVTNPGNGIVTRTPDEALAFLKAARAKGYLASGKTQSHIHD